MRVLLSGVFLLLAVPLLGAIVPESGTQTDWATIVAPLEKQVPRIEIKLPNNDETGICSGVVLNEKAGFVLSAAHCFPGKPEDLSITVNDRHAEVARTNRLLDLAVLRFRPKDEKAMPFAPESPPAGTEIAVAGFLLGARKIHVQFGRVAARRSDDGALVLDSVALPGDSGGAIVNAKGELVGMTNQYYRSTSVGLAVPVEKILDFAEQYLPGQKQSNQD